MKHLIATLLLAAIPLSAGAVSKAVNDADRGLRVFEEHLATPGLTLFAPKANSPKQETKDNVTSAVYLINTDGSIVHEWDMADATSQYAFLLEDGSLVYRSGTSARPIPQNPNARWQRIGWDGTVLWSVEDPSVHHDADLISEEELLLIHFEKMSEENQTRLQTVSGKDIPEEVWTDYLSVVNVQSGETIWEWHTQDELPIEEFPLGNSSEWTHINSVEFLPAGNPFSEGEVILFSARELDQVFAISYPEGELLWQWGVGVLTAQHDPSLTAEGTVLIFNNGVSQSQVIEVDPTTNEIVWIYQDDDLFSARTSGAQRLSNGNTRITEGDTGRILEVTPDGDTVWEYVNPYNPNGEYALFKTHLYSFEEVNWPDESIIPIPEPQQHSEKTSETPFYNAKTVWVFGIIAFFLTTLAFFLISRD